uniref:Uncharacterized protein n=1 Tax=Rhizophora mucronata TaxID=61149 RepID=A0A2P2PIY7_RHIMU
MYPFKSRCCMVLG